MKSKEGGSSIAIVVSPPVNSCSNNAKCGFWRKHQPAQEPLLVVNIVLGLFGFAGVGSHCGFR